MCDREKIVASAITATGFACSVIMSASYTILHTRHAWLPLSPSENNADKVCTAAFDPLPGCHNQTVKHTTANNSLVKCTHWPVTYWLCYSYSCLWCAALLPVYMPSPRLGQDSGDQLSSCIMIMLLRSVWVTQGWQLISIEWEGGALQYTKGRKHTASQISRRWFYDPPTFQWPTPGDN